MSSSRLAAKQQQQLNYFQQSPVRGQLEPSDGFSKTGWRYLQCTDTPNELRVLLPPRTAMIYAQLLRAEVVELAKDTEASWDRIVEIRHLKDRMIRKCQRLSRGASVRDKNTSRVMFFTVHAPPDFRMKEMERWFRSQGPDITQAEEIPAPARTTPYCCDKCGPPPQAYAQTAQQSRPPAQPRRASTPRSSHNKASISERIARRPSGSQLAQTASRQAQAASAQSSKHVRPETSPPPLPVPSRSRSSTRNPGALSRQRSTSKAPLPSVAIQERSRQTSPAQGLRTELPARATLQSPDPLPIPYRSPREASRFDDDDDDEGDDLDIPMVDKSPSPLEEEQRDDYDDLYADPPPVTHTPPIAHTPDPEQVAFPSSGFLETIHEAGDPGPGSSRPTLPRRRSSLKKSTSRLSIISQTKSVSWAMDKESMDPMAKFMEATQEVEVVAKELEGVRAEYHEQILEMREICKTVTTAIENSNPDSESLQRDESTLRDQEYKVLVALERMQVKESEYHKKVICVLEETKRVVQLCEKKKDHQDN
ncbi:hypothetical protein BXZ70DRAFT_1008171 [Cristinia sonorae]|uniref:Uncharacterized protein n=1 Tax=Cristinia sonorae TaxID=1940300 RepID=A0A8K0UQV4_9AGAR|nr:hypothetical protein BXZ70DRAFT_1008171 [Cristinia sonorae]